jgi:hypothetical protein
MDQEAIDSLLVAVRGGPFTTDIQRAVGRALARALPADANKLWRTTWVKLLECLPDHVEDGNGEAIQFAMRALFGLSLSQNGTEVKVRGPSDAKVGVLILGFGGASMMQLEPVDSTYKSLRPEWRTVTSTFHGVHGDEAKLITDRQCDEIISSLASCERILVHALSNNGYFAWMRLQKREPSLGRRLAAAVFDCGIVPSAGGHLDPEAWFHIFSKTTLGVMVVSDMTPPDLGILRAKKRLEAASRLLAKNANEVLGTPDDDLAWQCANEPPVPTLCLSSPIDPVVPQKGIYAFGERLVAAQPTRSVRHASISAPHCQLADKEPKAYADELQRLLDQADRLCKVPPLADVSDATANPSPTPSTASVVAAAGASSKAMPTESETMASVLAVYELSDVAGLIDPATIDLAAAFELLDTGGRVELLNQLKLAGLTKLSDRQKVANALGKQHRLRASA